MRIGVVPLLISYTFKVYRCDFYSYARNMACLKFNTECPKEQPIMDYYADHKKIKLIRKRKKKRHQDFSHMEWCHSFGLWPFFLLSLLTMWCLVLLHVSNAINNHKTYSKVIGSTWMCFYIIIDRSKTKFTCDLYCSIILFPMSDQKLQTVACYLS